MVEVFRAIVAFAFVLGILVFIHELGHYLAARWRGVHVDVFSIGFGKPLYRWYDKVGTEWRICPIPLGGYVKPHGFQDPDEATQEEKSTWLPGKTFHEKPVLDRSIVIAAGPFFNFMLAIVLFAGVFFFSGKIVVQPVAMKIFSNSSADKAGLQVHDTIVQIGSIVRPDVEQLIQFSKTHPNLATHVIVDRNRTQHSLPIVIGSIAQNGRLIGQLGIELEGKPVAGSPMTFMNSMTNAVKETWDVSIKTLGGLKEMIMGKRSAKELGGPLRIAQLSGAVAQGGISKLIYFMGILSINLGLINLFPIPVLDGGRLVFYALEAIMRKPVPKKIQTWGFQLGFALILFLFIFSTYNDVLQLGVIRWLTGHSS
ncbi:Metalloprotease MmpA [Commensalibacter sp. Nvir]|uniref:RIP metalloprotease RseP n=1 Tax=Commensalibacter sp. Nvir TaxID=3069817 RepID=UPI002D679806|nr:Metalloprotease MmpA [Commensalibacter sp. Nvir]